MTTKENKKKRCQRGKDGIKEINKKKSTKNVRMSTTLVQRTTTNKDKCVWNKIKETDGVPEKKN